MHGGGTAKQDAAGPIRKGEEEEGGRRRRRGSGLGELKAQRESEFPR